MAVRIRTWQEAYRVAMAAGHDAANRAARAANRPWARADQLLAGSEFERVMKALGFGPAPCLGVEGWP